MAFFTRTEAKSKTSSKRRPTADDYRRLGPAAVRGMNPKAKTPEMRPTGAEQPLVYVLGESPGKAEDVEGEPFVGPAGNMLRNAIPSWGLPETRFDNCVRTRPPNNRAPTFEEIECFRSTVVADIVAAKPRVVMGVGAIALRWATGLKAIKAARGHKYPVDIGGHVCWFVPVMHPAHLAKIRDEREDKVPGKEWAKFWAQDVEAAYDLADSDLEPEVVPEGKRWGRVIHCRTVDEVSDAVVKLLVCDAVGWDLETHRLRPYYADSKILSVAFSNGEVTYAIPIDHPGHRWGIARGEVISIIKRLMTTPGITFVAHNAPFDFEWMLHELGDEAFDIQLGCSLQAAYALDPGPPKGQSGLALDDLCIEHFGFSLKAETPGAAKVKRLREVRVEDVLDYNALDARWCLPLWRKLMDQARAEGMEESYQRQIDRIPAIVNAQAIGVDIDQDERAGLDDDLTGQIRQVEAEIAANGSVIAWERRTGEVFSAHSADMVGKLLEDDLGVGAQRTKTGKVCTSAGVLEAVRSESPVVDAVLRLRGLSKLRGTYVSRFDPSAEDSYVFPDGKIHCSFSISLTKTARLSSDSPNNQNWPKRKNKHVRKQLAAPPGHLWLAVDQGQIEARVIAMESRDPVWVRMIHEDYDVHQEWAEKIAGIDDDFARLLEEQPKAARHKSKNGWVFPSFFGSSVHSIIRSLELSDQRAAETLFDEFWSTFSGVREWQQAKWKQYNRTGFVTSLTGRRRLGPLSWNMVINSGVQCAASDICVDAMVRLHRRSRREDRPWLAPVLQIHDDLTFLVPEDDLKESVMDVVAEQLGFQAPWVNVPLSVEVEVGHNLAEMESVGVWTSAALAGEDH